MLNGGVFFEEGDGSVEDNCVDYIGVELGMEREGTLDWD